MSFLIICDVTISLLYYPSITHMFSLYLYYSVFANLMNVSILDYGIYKFKWQRIIIQTDTLCTPYFTISSMYTIFTSNTDLCWSLRFELAVALKFLLYHILQLIQLVMIHTNKYFEIAKIQTNNFIISAIVQLQP